MNIYDLNNEAQPHEHTDDGQIMSFSDQKASVNIQSIYPVGEKRVFSKSEFSTVDNLALNPQFSTGILNWTTVCLMDSLGNPLYSNVMHGGKTWIRLNCGIAQGDTSDQGHIIQTVNIPFELRYSVLEVSFLVCGLFVNFSIGNEDYEPVYINIDTAHPIRINYYYRPNGTTTVTVRLNKNYQGQEVSGMFVDYTDVQVKKASVTYSPVNKGISLGGSNMHFYYWLKDWNEERQLLELSAFRKMGGTARVWLSIEKLMAFVLKSNPVKKTGIASIYLTSEYHSATTAKVATGIDEGKLYYLDWFFDNCRRFDIKLQVCLSGGFGNFSGAYATLGVYEFLDTDPDVRNGFVALIASVVERYRNYENVFSWEIFNEAYVNWRADFSGFTQNAPYSSVRSTSYDGYRIFERQAYNAIKAIENTKPVVSNVPSSFGACLATDDVCDWFCPSFYPGIIEFRSFSSIGSGAIRPSRGFGQLVPGLALNTRLLAFAYIAGGNALPSELLPNIYYYVVDIIGNTFKLSLTPSGTPLTSISAGTNYWYLYSDDGGSISAQDYILQRFVDEPKFVGLSEFGGGVVDGLYLYRDDSINSQYILELSKRLQKYGIGYVNVWADTAQPLFDLNGILNKSGKAISDLGTSTATQVIPKPSISHDNTMLTGNVLELPSYVHQGVGGSLRPVFKQFLKTLFNTLNGTMLGSFEFGAHDGNNTTPYRIAGRMAAYATGNWTGTSRTMAPGRLSVQVQGSDGSEQLTDANSVFEFAQDSNKSKKPFSILLNAWNKNIFNLGSTRIWRNALGHISLKNGSDPVSDADGYSIFPLISVASDADYVISTSQSLVILPVVTQNRIIRLPTIATSMAGTYLTLIQRNYGNEFAWITDVPIRGFDGNSLTTLKNNTLYILVADPVSSVWRIVSLYHGDYFNVIESDLRYIRPIGLSSQYIKGDGTFALFPTSLSDFTNNLGNLTNGPGIANLVYNGLAPKAVSIDFSGNYIWAGQNTFSNAKTLIGGRLGLGSSNPDRSLVVETTGQSGNGTSQIRLSTYASAEGDCSMLLLSRAGGTFIAPVGTIPGDVLGIINSQGFRLGSGNINGAGIIFSSVGTAAGARVPTDIIFNAPTASGDNQALVIKSGGDVKVLGAITFPAAIISNQPIASVNAHDFLTRNSTTGEIEKVSSALVQKVAVTDLATINPTKSYLNSTYPANATTGVGIDGYRVRFPNVAAGALIAEKIDNSITGSWLLIPVQLAI